MIAVPPTIQALLAARLDQLDPAERVVLERGSVEGRVFHRGAVQALSPDEAQLVAPLTALVRRELLRPDRPQFPGEDAFRFRHLLIRDAAYDALPKSTRAELHERFAVWIAGARSRPRRAGRDRRLPPRAGVLLPRRARPGGRRFARVSRSAAPSGWRRRGRRPLRRGDMRAATSLLARAVALFPARRRSAAEPAADASGGRCSRRANGIARRRSCRRPSELRRAAGDRRVAAEAAVALTHLRLFTGAIDES